MNSTDKPTGARIHPLRQRLDQVVTARGLAVSRSQARDAIARGRILVNGVVVHSPSAMVSDRDELWTTVAQQWVSRGAEKLVAALDAFAVDPQLRIALDVGASTGGFTEVLLARGARRVYAVDVGQGQFHGSLREDPRIVLHEKTDARAIDAVIVPERVSLIVIDVSFIGLAKVLMPVLARADDKADLIALVKPQFEVGPDGVGKGGIVRDASLRETALRAVIAAIEEHPGWRIRSLVPSPLAGSDGNQEFLVWAQRT